MGAASKTVETTVNSINFGRAILTWLMVGSLSQMWGFLNSQQNLAYLPALKITNPANVIVYFQYLIKIVTFDPIPCDDLYKALGIFSFKWVDLGTNVEAFGDIGFDSRNFISALDFMYLLFFFFILSHIVAYHFKRCQYGNIISKIYAKRTYNGL